MNSNIFCVHASKNRYFDCFQRYNNNYISAQWGSHEAYILC